MRIRELLNTFVRRNRSDSRRRLTARPGVLEHLESRTLLTGNVTVSLVGANAVLTGDSLGNEVEIVVDTGSVVVRGLNGTTINQGTTSFALVSGATTFAGRLDASLGDGDDILTIGSGITFSRDVSLAGEAGADTLRVLGGTFGGDLEMRGGPGENSMLVDSATIGGSVSLYSLGAMLASLSNSTIHGNLTVLSGRGADNVVLQGVTIDKMTTILTGRGDDNIVIQNSTLKGQLWIFSGAGNDVVYVNSSSISRLAVIAMQRGNDTLQVLGGSSFGKPLVVYGGTGKDAANVASDTTTHQVIRISQKSKYFDAARIASRITDSTNGAIAKANALRTMAVPTLMLSTNVASVSESAGATAATLTVTRTGSTATALTVTLTSSNPSKATVPATVTILAGSTSITAVIAAVNNSIVDSDAVVTVTATAPGLVTGTHAITVTNDDVAALTLTANQTTVAESAGASAVTYTVSRNSADLTQPLTVNLTSSASGRLSVGSSVTIPANAASTTFVGSAVENTEADGNASVIFTASAASFANGTATVTVTDNDLAALSVTPDASTVTENAAAGSVTYTLTRNTSNTTQALVVALSSPNTARLGVPATVTIPAGAASVTFEVTPVNNTVTDGDVDVQLSASALGFVNAAWTITVTDDDVTTAIPTLSAALSTVTVLESAAAGASVLTVTRNNSNTTQELVVTLDYSAPGRLSGPASITIAVGATSAMASLSPINNTAVDGDVDVLISASAPGFATVQQTLTVVDNENAALSVTTTSSTVSEASGTLSGTVTTSVVSSADIPVALSYSNSAALTGPATVVIPAGATSVNVDFTVVNGSVLDQNVVAVIAAAANGATTGFATVTLTDADTMALTAEVSASDAVQSNNTIITRNNVVQVSGLSVAGATISVDSDSDGVFDNGTTIAGTDGSYSIDVTILNTATNHGRNQLVVKAVAGTDTADTAVQAHLAVGTVVHFASNKGAYDVELLDTAAPIAVANFLSYVESGAFQNLIVQRSTADTFIQGGGFTVLNGKISTVTTAAPIQGEFNAANSNVTGTLSMALQSDANGVVLPNSGTSGWFVNVGNNASLDAGGYTVFGRLIGNGVTVARAISQLTTRDLSTLYNLSALATVPLSAFSPANTPITGTVAIIANSSGITGTGTLFTSQLSVGQSIKIGTRAYFVAAIASDTSLTLTSNAPVTAELLTVLKDVVPNDSDFVVFSQIGKILDTL